MKSIQSIKAGFGLLALVCALAGATVTRAASYTINVNTSSIANNSGGPFYLDLQSLAGDGAQAITVSNFVFSGGSFISGTDASTGAVTGNLGSSVLFNPSGTSFLNDFWQQFDSAVTNIKFNLSFIPNVSTPTPTSFAVSILEPVNLYNIPTTGLGDTLLRFDINGSSTAYFTGVSTGETGGVTASVPDGANTAAMIFGAMLTIGCGRWSRRSPVPSSV